MIDLVKKAMFTGIGVLSLTKDKVEEVAKDFVDKGKLSEDEGKKLVKEILERSEETRGEVQKQVEAMVQATMAKMDIASKSDIAEVKKELSEIKAKIGKEKS